MHLRLFLRSLSRDARAMQSPTYLSPRTHASAMPLERKKVGEVFHFYGKIGVAAIRLTDDGIAIGDTVQIQGPSHNLEQNVETLQIEHATVSRADPGQEVGMKVRERVREKDFVYKLGPKEVPLREPPAQAPSPKKAASPKKAPAKKAPRKKKAPVRRKASRAPRSKARRASRRSRPRSR